MLSNLLKNIPYLRYNYYQHLYTVEELKDINNKALTELSLLKSTKEVVAAVRDHKYIVMIKSL